MVSKRKLDHDKDDKKMTASKRTKVLPGNNDGTVDSENIPLNMQNNRTVSRSPKSDHGYQLATDTLDDGNATQKKTSKKRLNLRKPTQTIVVKNVQEDLPKETSHDDTSYNEAVMRGQDVHPDNNDNVQQQDHCQGYRTSSSRLQACPICKCDISILKSDTERNEHINNCLDSNNTDSGINEPVSPRAVSNLLEFCQICSRDISRYNTIQRQQHMNRCCDDGEDANREKTEESVTYQCVICDKTFKTVKAKKSHLKKCAKTNNVETAELVKLNRNGNSEASSGIAVKKQSDLQPIPILADQSNVFVTAKKRKKKKKILSPNVTELDEGTQLALALSASMHMENKAEKTKQCNKKKNNNRKLPALLLRSENEAKKITEARAAAVLYQWGDSDEEIQATPALAPSNLQNKYDGDDDEKNTDGDRHEERNMRKNYLKVDVRARLWHAASLDPKNLMEQNFYVPNLLPDVDSKDAAISHPGLARFATKDEDVEKIKELPTDAGKFLKSKENNGNDTEAQLDLVNSCTSSPDGACRDELEITWLPPSGFCIDEKNTSMEKEQSKNEDVQSLISALSPMIGNPLLSDVDIVAKNQQVFPAHSFMLAARCDRLKKAIIEKKTCEVNVSANEKIVLQMEDIDIQAIRAVITFLYTATYTSVNSNIVDDLEKLIRRLDIPCNLNNWINIEEPSRLIQDPKDDMGKEENLDVLLKSLWEDDYKNTEDVDDAFGDSVLVDERFTAEMYSQRRQEIETQVPCNDENSEQFNIISDPECDENKKECRNCEVEQKSHTIENKQLHTPQASSLCETERSLPDDTINVKDNDWLKDTSGWLIPETPLSSHTSVTQSEKLSGKIVCDLTSTKEHFISANNQDSKSPENHDDSNKGESSLYPTHALNSSSGDAVMCMDVDSPNSSSSYEDVVLSPTCPSLSYFTPNYSPKDKGKRDRCAKSDWEQCSFIDNNGDGKMVDSIVTESRERSDMSEGKQKPIADNQVKYCNVGHRKDHISSQNLPNDISGILRDGDELKREINETSAQILKFSDTSRRRTEKLQHQVDDQQCKGVDDQDIDWFDDYNFNDTIKYNAVLNSTVKISDNNISDYAEDINTSSPRCGEAGYYVHRKTGRNGKCQNNDLRNRDHRFNNNLSGNTQSSHDANEVHNDDINNDIRAKNDNREYHRQENNNRKNNCLKNASLKNHSLKNDSSKNSVPKMDDDNLSSVIQNCVIHEDNDDGRNYDRRKYDHRKYDSPKNDSSKDSIPVYKFPKNGSPEIDRPGEDNTKYNRKTKREGNNESQLNSCRNNDSYNAKDIKSNNDNDDNVLVEGNENEIVVENSDEVQERDDFDYEIACYDDGGFNCDIDDNFNLYQVSDDDEKDNHSRNSHSPELDCNDDFDMHNDNGKSDFCGNSRCEESQRFGAGRKIDGGSSNVDENNHCVMDQDKCDADDEKKSEDIQSISMEETDHEIQDGGYSDSEIVGYDDGGFNCDIDDYFALQMSPKDDYPGDDITSTCVMKTTGNERVSESNVPEPDKSKYNKDNIIKTYNGISNKAMRKQSKKVEVQQKARPPGTPMLDYSNMATPDLQNNIKRYGVRPLPKKKMIMKLKEIYHYTHRDMSSESEHDDEVAVSNTEEDNCQTNSEECDLDDDGIEENPFSCENNQYGDEEGSDDPEFLSQESLLDLSTYFTRFLEQNQEAYMKILKYEPVPLSFFQEHLKQSGVNCSAEKLKNFLDEQCVTYTERKGSRTRKKQRKPRFQATK